MSASILRWCGCCGSQHPPAQACPRSIAPTGPEQRGWQIAVETPQGAEGYAVLLARSGTRWRARIMTFPNILWMVPGGGESIKFLARTEDEAERQAIDFIRRHCLARGFTMRDELQPVRAGAAGLIVGHPRAVVADEPRYRRHLPVHFGRSRPILLGQTANVSESGLFVTTEHVLPIGDSVGLALDLSYCKVAMRGSVVWQRGQPSAGLPQGMGLHVDKPPTIYVSYVRALVLTADEDAG